MKKKDKNLLLFALFLTFLMISIPSILTKEDHNVVDMGAYLQNSQVSWNVSDYDQLVLPPIDTSDPFYLEVFRIFIDDADLDYNWSKTEADNEWCSGSGTKMDPYIIENIYVDAQGDGGGIYILNSDKYFTIRNCWINNSGLASSDAAVLLRFTENGIIEENIFTYTRVGIWLEFDCFNISISGNYMIGRDGDTTRALALDLNCNEINITGNRIYNFYSGMYMNREIDNLIMSNNYITNTYFTEWEDPPVRFDEVNNSKVVYNTLDGVYSKAGVFVDVIGGSNNTVVNNTIVAGGGDVPEAPILSAPDRSVLNMQDCNNNLVAHNRILKSSDLGIPGYDSLLILSLFGIMFTVLAIKITLKKHN